MIKMKCDRDKPGDEFFPGEPRNVSIGAALHHFHRWDFRYNMQVTVFRETELQLRVQIGHCVDITTYEGDARQMAVLLRAVCYGLILYGRADYGRQLHSLLSRDDTKPTWQFNADTELMKGPACGKGLVLLAMEVLDQPNVSFVTGKGWYLDDAQLCSVLELVRETGMTVEEVVAACEPVTG